MVLSELRKKAHLSASSIGTYVECSLMYKFAKIDKIPVEYTGDALKFGSAIHLTLEKYYLEKQTGVNLPLKDVQDIFESHWRDIAEDKDDIEYTKGNTFTSLLMLGLDMLLVWHNKSSQNNYEIIGVEQAFEFYIPGIDIPIIGAIDLLEKDEGGVIIITDHKTAGRAYSKDDIDKNQQLTLYQMAIREMGYDGQDILLKFDTLIKGRVPRFEQYWTVRSHLAEHRFIKKALQVWDGIQKGVFIPNDTSWKCGYCNYKEVCDFWFGRKIE